MFAIFHKNIKQCIESMPLTKFLPRRLFFQYCINCVALENGIYTLINFIELKFQKTSGKELEKLKGLNKKTKKRTLAVKSSLKNGKSIGKIKKSSTLR